MKVTKLGHATEGANSNIKGRLDLFTRSVLINVMQDSKMVIQDFWFEMQDSWLVTGFK